MTVSKDVDAEIDHLMMNGPEEHDVTLSIQGYPIGAATTNRDEILLSTHLHFHIFYHSADEPYTMYFNQHASSPSSTYRIVGAQVSSYSTGNCESVINQKHEKVILDKQEIMNDNDNNFDHGRTLTYSYSVTWSPSDTSWATRWDVYLSKTRNETLMQWISLTDTVLLFGLVLLFVGLIFGGLVRTHISRYNSMDDFDEGQSSGWKMLHGDVYRRPWGSRLLATFVGSGVQVTLMVLFLSLATILGVIRPDQRALVIQSAIVVFALFGSPAGYCSAKLNRRMDRDATNVDHRRGIIITTFTAFLYPAIMLALYILANFCLMTLGGNHVPFTTILILVFLWLFLSVPLTLFGAYMGYRQEIDDNPVRVNKLPRAIPKNKNWFTSRTALMLLSGFITSATGIAEVTHIQYSIVKHSLYTFVGSLLLTTVCIFTTAGLFG